MPRKIKRIIKPILKASPQRSMSTSPHSPVHHLKHEPQDIDSKKIKAPPPAHANESSQAPILQKFLLQYNAMKEMREEHPAPVDTMGCHTLHDEEASPKVQRFHTLVSLLLSSQTKDAVTAKAMSNLKAEGLSVDKVLSGDDALDDVSAENASDRDAEHAPWSVAHIEQMIYPASFYKRKARNLRKIAHILKDEYNGDIPRKLEGLLKLPGIGPKMGHLIMTHAWHDTQGIGVDVHVHRISNRLEWVHTKTPEETRKALEKWLPKEYWNPINEVVVGFGQTICAARPKCGKCLMGALKPETDVEETLCPFYEKMQLGVASEDDEGGPAARGKKSKRRSTDSGATKSKRRKPNPKSEDQEDL